MSEVSSSAVWNDDGPSSLVDAPKRSPPPLPVHKPVTNIVEKSTPTSDLPGVDLIQFESEEERAATIPNGSWPTKVAASDEVQSMDDIMRNFLKEEGSYSHQDYVRRFYQIRMEQDKFRMQPNYSSDCAIAPQHFARNRYRDILPYDHNRVEIQRDDENPDGYMNASFIEIPGSGSRFIAAQAPLPTTLDEWWKMIDQHQISLIVILCKIIEMNKVKCERYWPVEIGECEIFGDYEITLQDETTYDDDEYLLRKLLMQNQSTGKTRTIYQLHYREWPDHGCPSGEKQLINMIEEMNRIHKITENPTSPILVHCSAGVGRTGTIIAVNYVREQIESGNLDSLDVFSLVLLLRRQRASMVQTQDQYQFVHRCISAYCRQKLGIAEPVPTKLPTAPEIPTASGSSVRLIAPPTPTEQDIGSQTIPHDVSSGHTIEGFDSEENTNVPDFPLEPPAPRGPEKLSSAAL